MEIFYGNYIFFRVASKNPRGGGYYHSFLHVAIQSGLACFQPPHRPVKIDIKNEELFSVKCLIVTYY